MPLNPDEAPLGYRAVPELKGCCGCAFDTPGSECGMHLNMCMTHERADHESVIFVKLPVPAHKVAKDLRDLAGMIRYGDARTVAACCTELDRMADRMEEPNDRPT